MEKHCRAKDPSTCRVHGSSDRSLPVNQIIDNHHLEEIADSASASGDLELYIQAKAQMEKNIRETVLAAVPEKVELVSEKAGATAAEVRWRTTHDSYDQNWDSLSTGHKAALIKREQETLAEALPHMPHGVVTNEAVEAMSISRYEALAGTGWDRLPSSTRKELKENSRVALEAAAPHMGISINAKASIRNMFRHMEGSLVHAIENVIETKENVEGTVLAGIDKIADRHEEEIPSEIGGNTVAWSDLNPFKSPFKNGKLR